MSDNNNNNIHYNFFERLIESIKKNGKKNVTYGVIIFFLLLNIIANPININRLLDKWENKQECVHLKGIEKRKEADLIIPDKLDNIMLKSGADRVMILEFHNGGRNSVNLPFYHFTSTYEVVRDTIDYVSDQYQNQNSGNYAVFFEQLNNYNYLYVSDLTIDDNHLHRKMLKNGTKSYFIAGIYESNKLMALLTITSNTVNGLDVNYLKGVAHHTSNQLSHILSGVGKRG